MWYYFEDRTYLQPEELKKLNNPIVIFNEKDLTGELLKKVLQEEKSILAPFLPPEKLKNLFVVKELPNKYSPFTTEEWEFLNSLSERERKKEEANLLREKLGLNLFKPEIKLSQLGGMENLKRYVRLIKVLDKSRDDRLKVKGIFLAGIAGTGKSFSAKAVAGELDRLLVELNLSKVMETPNPVFTLHKIFQYLEKLSIQSGMKFILWIDEIEKMFASLEGIEKKLLGQLLTILNDLNTDEGYKVDAIFWATANDIKAIVEKNPEFLRSGRFDALFFVDTPCYPNEAIEIFKIYFKSFKLPQFRNPDLWRELIDLAQKDVWENLVKDYSSPDINVYIYTPAEIAQVVKEVKRDFLLIADILNVEYSDDKTIQILNTLYEKLFPDFSNEKFKSVFGEGAKFFINFREFMLNYSESLFEAENWEKVLLGLFYNEMFKVSPILKTARETITELRSFAKEYLIKVSDCSRN
jgi:MoxR-like ATPase